MQQKKVPPEVLDFLRKAGSKGGKARAQKYTKKQLSEIGKKGGRPKGSGTKQARAATKKGGK